MMRQTRWIVAASITLAVAAASSRAADGTDRTYRIGFVGVSSPGLAAVALQSYQQRLRELGWVEGQNLSTTYRWADGGSDRFPNLVHSIMSAAPDLLVLPCRDPIMAARDLSPNIPIVAFCLDLKGFGREIATVARPGGFTTGVTGFSPGVTGRRLEFLRELVPTLSRVGVVYDPASSWAPDWDEIEAAARATRVSLERIEWKPYANPGDGFHIASKRRVQALMTFGDGPTYHNRHSIFEWAAHYRLPVMYDFPMWPAADEVGLIAYHADVGTMFRTIADQVDQILRGRKPGDIPLAFPEKFNLVVSEKAARALGLSISPSLRQLADQVIE
jgi:putative ABC transport system substrate-binding protein